MKTHSQSKQTESSSIQAKAQNQASEGHILQAYKAGISQLAEDENSIQKKENKTGLPDNLKSGVENLSGHSLDDVKVHYNSSQPANLQAHAYAQGTDIHVAPGQEKHLPHEAWHVVQQKQGRVQPTKQLKGTTNINDDAGLEKEADVMGAKAMQLKSNELYSGFESIPLQQTSVTNHSVQLKDDTAIPDAAKGFGFSAKDMEFAREKLRAKKGESETVQTYSKAPIQRASACAGLGSVNRALINPNGQRAYDLLDHNRAGFAAIPKAGQGVNAAVDGENRVVSAHMSVTGVPAARLYPDQTIIGWLGRLEEGQTTGYDGGHLIASSLGGPGTWGNMVPQDAIENRWGDWRQYEREIAAMIAHTHALPVLSVTLGYPGDSVLPSSWDSTLTDIHGTPVNWYTGLFT
ncbi:DNA/RNA non-specific endonuclease [Fluviicola sp.]|uniref:DNA/RNA non-specific endonuclease n=1 Tax=Fluviicola sp. TaxID=1917219 RepID=UPI003D266A37